MFLNARDGKFPRFFGKNPVPRKRYSGTQTSSLDRDILYRGRIRYLENSLETRGKQAWANWVCGLFRCTLVGPPGDNPELDPLAVLHLNS